MGDDGATDPKPRRNRRWIRRLFIGLATIFLLLVVFHGPILRSVVHSLAIHFAAKQNLKLDFRIEGDVLSGVALRNVHATATGPSAVQSLDADLVRASYSLTDLAFHGMSDFLKDVEVRNLTAVLDLSKAPIPRPTPPPKNEKLSLPAFFPDRLEVTNANLTMRGQPQDTVVRNLNLGLYPDREGRTADRQAADPERPHLDGHHRDDDLREQEPLPAQPDARRRVIISRRSISTLSKTGGGKLALEVKGSVGKGDDRGQGRPDTTKSSFKTTTKVKAPPTFR